MSGEHVTTRFVAIAGLMAVVALSACGGEDSSATTTPPPDQSGLDWSRCSRSDYLTSTVGISCQDADRFINREALGKTPTGGKPQALLKADPRNFEVGAFDCTAFAVQVGAGWHVFCQRADRHVSFFISP
jgi:hypothetical protein